MPISTGTTPSRINDCASRANWKVSGVMFPDIVNTRPIGIPNRRDTCIASVRSAEVTNPLLTSKSPIIMFLSSSDIQVPRLSNHGRCATSTFKIGPQPAVSNCLYPANSLSKCFFLSIPLTGYENRRKKRAWRGAQPKFDKPLSMYSIERTSTVLPARCSFACMVKLSGNAKSDEKPIKATISSGLKRRIFPSPV